MCSTNFVQGRELATLWKIYFDFQYFFLICPFRLKIYEGEVRVKSWFPQKLLCGIVSFFGFFWILRNVRLSQPINAKNPAMFLLMANLLTISFLKLLTIKQYWRNQHDLVKILQLLLDTSSHSILPTKYSRSESTKWNVIFTLMCSVYTGMALSNWITGSSHLSLSSDWSTSWWWDQMVEGGRFNFFLGNGTSFPLENLCGAMAAIGFLWRLVLGSNVEFIVLIAAITMWLPARQFSAYLQKLNSTSHWKTKHRKIMFHNFQILKSRETDAVQQKGSYSNWEEIFMEYEALKELTALVNQMFGWNLGYVVLEIILYNSISFDEIFIQKGYIDWGMLSTVGIYLLTTSSALLLSADVCSKVMETVR